MTYLVCFCITLVLSLLLTPLMRFIAIKYEVFDIPHSEVKTHKNPVPYLGGVAIALAFWAGLTVIRLFTNFPTGTLNSLRGIFIGSFIIFLLGIYDDITYKGISFKAKFPIQILCGIVLVFYGIKMKFLSPEWVAITITVIWIVGVTNALNIIDIMDGLSSGVTIIAALGFFFIGIPKNEEIYVNFASIALAAACLGYLPFNLSRKYRIFMGDAGSLFIGFILAAISLGTRYTEVNNLGLFAPILILAVPIYDTFLVSYLRLRKGTSPFKGSKDHFALRLEVIGYSRKTILVYTYITASILAFISFAVTVVHIYTAVFIYLIVIVIAFYLASKLSKIKIG